MAESGDAGNCAKICLIRPILWGMITAAAGATKRTARSYGVEMNLDLADEQAVRSTKRLANERYALLFATQLDPRKTTLPEPATSLNPAGVSSVNYKIRSIKDKYCGVVSFLLRECDLVKRRQVMTCRPRSANLLSHLTAAAGGPFGKR
jgi:hypothetical protein